MQKVTVFLISVLFAGQAFALGIRDFELASPIPVKDIEYTDSNKNNHNLNDLKGKVVLVNFWATWCIPCVKEMPALAALAKSFEGKDVVVLPLSIDYKGEEAVKEFYASQGIRGLPVYIDEKGRGFKTFGLQALPTTIVINKDGLEVARILGEIDWTGDEVRQYLLELL